MGGMVRAAHNLHITQPAVTARIKALEMALGTELFERAPGGLKLTKRGRLLRAHAERLVQLTDKIERDIVDPAGVEGHLRIGASETIAQCWLPDLITSLHKRHPKLAIEFNVDVSVNLRAALLSREIDLAFLLGPISDYSVDNVELPAFELAWYAAAGTPGDPERLFDKPVITYARNTRPFRELEGMLLERIGPDVPVFPSSSLSACFRLIEAGLGVAALPKLMGHVYVGRGSIEEFDPGWKPAPLRFSASFLGDPASHLIKSAAMLAQSIAKQFDHKFS